MSTLNKFILNGEELDIEDTTARIGITTLNDSLSTVATTGNYDDLSNKPVIPSGVIVDSDLSTTSENPVQNKIITSSLNDKASTSVATTSANGLMSSSDKTKLDGISTGANKTTFSYSSNVLTITTS